MEENKLESCTLPSEDENNPQKDSPSSENPKNDPEPQNTNIFAQEEEKKLFPNDFNMEKSSSETNLPSEKDIKKPPQYNLEKRCFVCQNNEIELSLCSRCRLIYYCSPECQKKDWKNHKDYCIPVDKQPNREVVSLDHFKDLNRIGIGNFSDIYSALNIFDKKTYAIKIIEKAKLKRIRKEADILMEKHCLKKLMGNPYVIEIYSTFQDDLNLFLQFEFMKGGELWEKVKVFGLDSLALVRFFMAQIILAIESIHKSGIVHRDLKPENILLDEKFNVKLVDFGTARDLFNPEIKGSGNSAKGKRVYDHFVGTPQFMAPECIRNRNSDYKSDIWSLGCVTFQLVNGFPPFLGGSEYLIFQKSINENPVFPEHVFNEEIKDLIERILKKEPEERPSLMEIKSHKFFDEFDWNAVRDNYKYYDEKMTKEEEFWKNIRKKVLTENIVLLKREELDKIMEFILSEIQKNEVFGDSDAKKRAELKAKNLEKQLAHFYKLNDYEY